MKRMMVSEILGLQVDSVIENDFRVRSAKPAYKNNGDHYIVLELADHSGTIGGKWWKGMPADLQDLQNAKYVNVYGRLDEYNGVRSINADFVIPIDEPVDVSQFLPVAALPLDVLERRVKAHWRSVKDQDLAAVLDGILGDPKIWNRFVEAPAATHNHHACRHGLIQHTLEVTDMAAAMSEVQATWGYRPVSRDLIVTAALLHDLGKIYELTGNSGDFSYTTTGELIGHISIAVQVIGKACQKIPRMTQHRRDMLLHTILSHHGKGEYGSPKAPMFAEAQIVHAADVMDMQLFLMQERSADAAEDFVWVKSLDNRRIYTRAFDTPETVSEEILVRKPLPTIRFATQSGTDYKLRREVPLIGRVAAGTPIPAIEDSGELLLVDDETLTSSDELFALRVKGESMTGDGIMDGDIVLVRAEEENAPGNIMVVHLTDDDEAAIKRIEYRGGNVVLASSNPAFDDIPVLNPESMTTRGRIIGRLVAA